MYKSRFDSSSKKYLCPRCGKKRFVRYVDADNNLLPDQFGRCDREANCGYWLKPEQQDVIDLKPIKIQKRRPPSYIAEGIVQKSLSHYHLNSFFNYLTTKFDKELVLQTFQKYRVGTSKHWGGSPVFWQTDVEGRVRTGKIIKYCEKSGKRIKIPYNHITWAHIMLGEKNFYLEQVAFGIHLINKSSDTAVCIVESEKTAIIMDLFCPEFIWISIGSLTQLTYKPLKPLIGRNIILYPDSDGYEIWNKKAQSISSQLQQKILVSDLIMSHTVTKNQCNGFDLADMLF